jgi:hypothetical protein
MSIEVAPISPSGFAAARACLSSIGGPATAVDLSAERPGARELAAFDSGSQGTPLLDRDADPAGKAGVIRFVDCKPFPEKLDIGAAIMFVSMGNRVQSSLTASPFGKPCLSTRKHQPKML